MPYITNTKRQELDPHIDALRKALVHLELDDENNNTEGNINYIITELITMVYESKSYRSINDVVGLLESCKLEFYGRYAAPYEALKAHENGDVYPNDIEQEIANNFQKIHEDH